MNRLILYNYINCRFCNSLCNKQKYLSHLRNCKKYIFYLYKKYKSQQIEYKPQFITHPGSFKKFIENKRVIIVGPSYTTSKCYLGKFIDNFDVIVRLNKSLPIRNNMKIHIGSRTDILYNSLNKTDDPGRNNFSPLFLKKNNVKFLRCSYPPKQPFLADIQYYYIRHKNSFNFSHIDLNYYNKLEKSMYTRPYTGTCAIADLMKYNLKELYVMGIDFYTYKYVYSYKNISERRLLSLRSNTIHQRTPQIELIRRFYLLDNRLKVDNILNGILTDNYKYVINIIKKQISANRIFINGKGQFLKQNLDNTICIVGDIGEIKNNFSNIDWIIDIVPERNNKIRDNDVKYISNNFIENNENTIFLKKYSKNIPKKFKKNNYFFINSHFTEILKKVFTRTIFSNKSLTLDLFVILTYSIFFKNVYISNINPNNNWVSDKYDKNHSIAQRMLFQYLLRNKNIMFM